MDLRPLLTEDDLSKLLKSPVSTLQNWRWRGVGPKFIKTGHHVRYRPTDVEEWLDERTRTRSTRGEPVALNVEEVEPS